MKQKTTKISRRNLLLTSSGIAVGLLLPRESARAIATASPQPSQAITASVSAALDYLSKRSMLSSQTNFGMISSNIHPGAYNVLSSERERFNALSHLGDQSNWNGLFDSIQSKPYILSAIQSGNQVQLLIQDWVDINWRPSPAQTPIFRSSSEIAFVNQDPIRYGLNVPAYNPTNSGFGTIHCLTLELLNSQWVITKDGYVEPILSITSLDYSNVVESHALEQAYGSANVALKGVSTNSGNEVSSPQLSNSTSIFDYKSAVAYALLWENSYNPAYPNYASTKADCANFVSQSLRAGGHQITPTWNYSPMQSGWNNNMDLRKWLITSGRGHDETAGMLGLADCVNYAWHTTDSLYDHIAIVTGFGSVPLVTCHTSPVLNAPYNAIYGATYAPNQTREYTGTYIYY